MFCTRARLFNCEIRKSFTVDEFSFSFGAHNICIHAVITTTDFSLPPCHGEHVSRALASDESVLKMKVYDSLFALANACWLHLFYDSSLPLSIHIHEHRRLNEKLKVLLLRSFCLHSEQVKFYSPSTEGETSPSREIRLNDNLDFSNRSFTTNCYFPVDDFNTGRRRRKIASICSNDEHSTSQRVKNGDLWKITRRRLEQLPHVGDGIASKSLGTL